MNQMEVEIIKSIREISTPFFDTLFEIITFFGEKYILVIILAVFYFIVDKKLGQRLTYTLFCSLAINGTIKGLVRRTRPFIFDPTYTAIRQETATGYSFPSGHTQNITTTLACLCTMIKRNFLYVCSAVLILLVAYSRVHLGVHYPSDVIVAIIIALIITLFATFIHKKFEDNYNKQLIVYLVTLVIFCPFLLIFLFQAKEESNFILALSNYRDYYISYALFVGYVFGSWIENRFVNFNCDCSLKLRFIRLFGAGILATIIYFSIKFLLPNHILFDMLRYFLVTFVCLGLYPLCTKRWLFKD